MLGKASRKVAKKQQKIKVGEQNKESAELKQRIAAYKAAGNYEDALLLVIELLERKCYDVEVLFDAAELYFMAEDYERTSIWINKTLEFDPGHIGARILLAHICMLSDRLEDALKLLEFLLRTAKERMTEAEYTKIEELLEYFKYTRDIDELKQDYPHIAAFLKIEVDTISTTMEAVPETAQSAQSGSAQHVEQDVVMAEKQPSEKEAGTASVNMEQVKKEIAAKQVSLQQKISLYNSFAGACFFENRLQDAALLLEEALQIDPYHTETLCNMVEISLEQGDKERALQYMADLPITDFSLLKKIREV